MGDSITGYPDHFIINDDTTSCPCAEHSPDQSARETLERAASASAGSPEYDVWFGLLLDRYRDEVAAEYRSKVARIIPDREHIVKVQPRDMAALRQWLERPNGAHGRLESRVTFEAVEDGGIWVRTRPIWIPEEN
jgi:hypothetical protein